MRNNHRRLNTACESQLPNAVPLVPLAPTALGIVCLSKSMIPILNRSCVTISVFSVQITLFLGTMGAIYTGGVVSESLPCDLCNINFVHDPQWQPATGRRTDTRANLPAP